MKPQQILESALKHAEGAEVFHIRHKEEPAVFEANRLKRLESLESSGIALRIIKNGRIGFSSTTDQQDARSLIANAVEMAPFGPKAWLKLPDQQQYPRVMVNDHKMASIQMDDMVHLGQGMIDRVVKHTSKLVCSAKVVRETTAISIYNGCGCEANYTKTTFSAGIEGVLVDGTDMLFVWDAEASCHPITDTTRVTDSIIRQLELSRRIVPAPAGDIPVLFLPDAIAEGLVQPLQMGLNGRLVLQGASPLVGKLGNKMLDKKLSLYDDPTLAYIPGSRKCDDEGVPSRRLALIEKGVITSFYYDLQTAAQAGALSTGSAHRNLATMPTPGASVLLFSEGDASEEAMIRGIKRGLVVEHLLGAGQSNVQGGEFSANVLLGYLVENGRIKGRVKDTLISGNVYTVLSQIRAIGNKARWVGGSLKTPPFLCEGVAVASKS